MKILMLGWELPPHNSGGLGVATYQLCKALAKRGADIEFILPYTASHDIDFMRINPAHPQDVWEVLQSGIAYDSFKYVTADGKTTYKTVIEQSAIYEEAVSRIVQVADFDVIHAHDWLTCRAGMRAKMASGKPLIVHVHSVEADRSGRPHGGNPLVREIEGLSMLVADRIIAVSEHTKRTIMREYDIPSDKIEVVYNCFDPASLVPAEGDNAYKYIEHMKRQGYRVVVNVGRLTIQKGLPNLLHAMKPVIERAPKTLLVIVGSGEQRNELIQLAADLGIGSNVIFTGFLRGKKWRDAYEIADLFVMPSVSEPFGLVALEAISYGTPVLISRQSGVAEVLHNALKVDFWDTDEMANKITAVMQNDALRDEMHANSLQECDRLSWDDSAEKLWGIYEHHRSGAAV